MVIPTSYCFHYLHRGIEYQPTHFVGCSKGSSDVQIHTKTNNVKNWLKSDRKLHLDVNASQFNHSNEYTTGVRDCGVDFGKERNGVWVVLATTGGRWQTSICNATLWRHHVVGSLHCSLVKVERHFHCASGRFLSKTTHDNVKVVTFSLIDSCC